MTKKIAVIGSGFSGLASATILAKKGYEVTVFEKNEQIGGRARSFQASGYTFDMGPSWYWMPDVFERYFSLFDKKAADFYELRLLDPGFRIFFGKNDTMDIPASLQGIYELFEREESGAAAKLEKFLSEAELKYKLAMDELVYMPSERISEFARFSIVGNLPRLHIFQSFRSHARKYFNSPRLQQLIGFPVLFLGGTTSNIPAMYSLMNYAAFNLSTWYPMGGFGKVTQAMTSIATDMGVQFRTGESVTGMNIKGRAVYQVHTPKGAYPCNGVIGSSDYQHTEGLLLPSYRNYKEAYWPKRVLAPSCLIFYLGISKKLPALQHHNLFFDEDLDRHAEEIYDHPQWPEKPLFYVCCTSKTDAGTAPQGHENLFVLMPLAAGLEDNDAIRAHYFKLIMERMEQVTGEQVHNHIDYQRSYCIKDFQADYNAYRGNAYGLANTLMQTAVMRPVLRNKKIKNLFYCGHLTVPGPGVPPALISGQIAARQLVKALNHES
jgi:phytoene desaturase